MKSSAQKKQPLKSKLSKSASSRTGEKNRPSPITPEEMDKVILAYLAGMRKQGVAECDVSQLQPVIKWATLVRVRQGLLETVLDGQMVLFHKEGDLYLKLRGRPSGFIKLGGPE